MMTSRLRLWLSAAFLCGFAMTAMAQEPADFVLIEGRIQTLDAKETVAQAIAIRNEKVVFVGSNEGAKVHIGPKTEVFRANGRTVIPGINETHVHPTGAAQGEVNEPFIQLHSIGEIQSGLKQFAEAIYGAPPNS